MENFRHLLPRHLQLLALTTLNYPTSAAQNMKLLLGLTTMAKSVRHFTLCLSDVQHIYSQYTELLQLPLLFAFGCFIVFLCTTYYFLRYVRGIKRTEQIAIEHKRHRRASSSIYPPGLQFDRVMKRWATHGMEPPLV